MFLSSRISQVRPQVAGIALALSVGLSGAVATAQGTATPGSSDEGIVCAQIDESASPMASPAASPATEEMKGEPVTDEATISELTNVATTCNEDTGEGIDVDSVEQYDDNLYGIEYQYMQGAQVFRVLEVYSVENDTWSLQQQQSESPETEKDTITISAKIGGDPTIDVTPGSFNIVPAMRVNILNQDSSDLSLTVFSATDEVDTDDLTGTDVASVPETMELQGETLVPAGTSGEMLFEGLGEGDYVLAVLDADDSIIGTTPLTIEPPLDLGL